EKQNRSYQQTYPYIFDCDLLIIDDLGTEIPNSFTVSQFFLCINERILRKKSTLISSTWTWKPCGISIPSALCPGLSAATLSVSCPEAIYESRRNLSLGALPLNAPLAIPIHKPWRNTVMLLQRSQRVLETIPVGSLGLIPLKSCEE